MPKNIKTKIVIFSITYCLPFISSNPFNTTEKIIIKKLQQSVKRFTYLPSKFSTIIIHQLIDRLFRGIINRTQRKRKGIFFIYISTIYDLLTNNFLFKVQIYFFFYFIFIFGVVSHSLTVSA